MSFFRSAFTTALVAILSLTFTQSGNAATLTVLTDQSSLNIGVWIIGPDGSGLISAPQAPGSDTTDLFGTINATIGASSIEITGASIGLNLQPAPQEPLADGVLPGSAPAQYGLFVDIGIVSGPAAVRDATATATSSPLPVVAGAFDATGVTLELATGFVDVNLSGFLSLADRLDVAGFGAPNETSAGTWDGSTLTIPVLVTVPIESDDIPVPLFAIFSGQIVAAVPEPASATLLLVGAVAVVPAAVRLRKRRRAA